MLKWSIMGLAWASVLAHLPEQMIGVARLCYVECVKTGIILGFPSWGGGGGGGGEL